MKITVIGLGFVGLTTALGFADKGFEVHGYDTNTERSEILRNKKIPFFEHELDKALERTLNKNFYVANSVSEAVENANCVFLCVGTPSNMSGAADLTSIFSAIEDVVKYIKSDGVLVIKSTVPPGTTLDKILPYTKSLGFTGSITNNPEFLREGYCWNDFVHADRIVCGLEGDDENAKQLLTELYREFDVPIHFVTLSTAEFIKYLSNSLLATLISFSNEMALIANATGNIDIGSAFKVLHEDKRLKNAGISSYIYPGCGYGGYCLPKDTVALLKHAKDVGINPEILDGVINLNKKMHILTAQRIKHLTNSKESKIGILGLSFKPNSNDVRDSSAAKIILELINDGYNNIHAYDPIAMDEFQEMYNLQITYNKSMKEVCENCDVIAIVTTWTEFATIHKLFPNKTICDCRYWLED